MRAGAGARSVCRGAGARGGGDRARVTCARVSACRVYVRVRVCNCAYGGAGERARGQRGAAPSHPPPPQQGGGGERALESAVRRPPGIPPRARGHAREKFIAGARGCQRAAGSGAGRCGAGEHRSPPLGGNNRWARRGGRCRRGAGGDAGSARAGQRRSVLLGTGGGEGEGAGAVEYHYPL